MATSKETILVLYMPWSWFDPATTDRSRPWRGRRRFAAVVTAVAVIGVPALAVVVRGDTGLPRSAGGSVHAESGVPLSPSDCRTRYQVGCLGAPQLRRLYGLDRLPTEGEGATIGLVLPMHNPRLAANLATYSAYWHLPAPRLEVIRWPGTPTADPRDPKQAINAEEGAFDVQLLHALAPRATLIYLEVPTTDTTGGTAGLHRLTDGVRWLTTHRRIDALGMSYGTWEPTFAEQDRQAGGRGDYHLMLQLGNILREVAATGTTLLAATGDSGAAGHNLAGEKFEDRPAATFPATAPWVTGVGATTVDTDDAGNRRSPEVVMNDGHGHAGGGGLSLVYSRPRWQDPYADTVGPHRGSVDIAMNGGTGMWFNTDYQALPNASTGWTFAHGSSGGVQLATAVVALGASLAGHPLGNINPALAHMAADPGRNGLLDVVDGDNTANGIHGWAARPGWDIPTGAGTIADAPRFLDALITYQTPAA